MIVDKKRGLSSYFIYRYGFNEEVSISDKYPNHIVDLGFERIKVKTGEDLLSAIKSLVEEATADGKTALALSGGIDSAILAKYMPAGSRAYTFRCIVPGIKVTDETEIAYSGGHGVCFHASWRGFRFSGSLDRSRRPEKSGRFTGEPCGSFHENPE